MSRSFAWIRATVIIVALITTIVPSVLPQLSLGYQPSNQSNTVMASSDGDVTHGIIEADLPPDTSGGLPARPAAQITDWAGGCALGITISAFLDDADDPGGIEDDYPTEFLVPNPASSFASYGFYDVAYPAPNGQDAEVTVGDQLVIYAAIENIAEIRCLFNGQPPADGLEIAFTGFELAIDNGSSVSVVDIYNSITWTNGTPGILGESERAIVQFSYEVAPTDTQLTFRSTASYGCADTDQDPDFCAQNPSVVTESTNYPAGGIGIVGNDGGGATNYQDYYGDPNPVVNVVGPRATVTITANGSVADITATPFEVVNYEITLQALSDGVDAISRLDSSEFQGVVIPECSLAQQNSFGPDVGWFVNDVKIPDIANISPALESGDEAVCRFTRTMDPVIVTNPLEDTFTLRGDIQIANQTGQIGNLGIVAPDVLIADAGITLVKSVLSPPPGTPVRVGDIVEYQLTIINSGNARLTNFRLVDSLVGIVPVSRAFLDPGDEVDVTVNYEVEESDPSPLQNTATIEAQVSGAPPGFTVSDSSAATVQLLQDELQVNLVVTQVDGVPYNPSNRATLPRVGSVITYRVEYCNQSDSNFRDLRYINNTPTYIDGASPTFVDAALLDGNFVPGCYISADTEFTYTVPPINDPTYSDPIINSVRARAVTQDGSFVFADSTIQTNVVSDTIEISAVRYSNITGEELDETDAALRGEVTYYHIDLENRSATDVCNVVIRHYVRNSQGQLIPGDPFIITDNYIDWISGIPGRLNADDSVDGSGTDFATSRTIASPEIGFTIRGDTPDPLYRVFEVEATTDCSGTPLAQPFIDSTAVFTDISNVQLNNLIEVFLADQFGAPTGDALDFGLLLNGQRYVFRYSSTNVGTGFTIRSLRYCFITDGSCAFEPDFPADAENFFTPGSDDEFLPFETRTDVSDVLTIAGDEQTPIQILVTLEGREGDSNVTVRVVRDFLLLTENLPGEIIDGDEELVRGDGPVPYEYTFVNETGGPIQNVVVFNFLEQGDAFELGVYENIDFPGFPANEFYEVCDRIEGPVLANQTIQGTCFLTYRDGLPANNFQMQVLLVGERTVDLSPVISIAALDVTELPHLTVEKQVSPITPATVPATFTITVENNSRYQPVEFNVTGGLIDVLEPSIPGATLPSLRDFSGFNEPPGDGSAVRTLPPRTVDTQSVATLVYEVLVPADTTSLTNTSTFVGTTLANPTAPSESVPGRSVTGTATAATEFLCPITQFGFFVQPGDPDYPGPVVNEDTDGFFTIGEGRWVQLFFVNTGSIDLYVAGIGDDLFQRENGRALNLTTDVSWPDPSNQGVLLPGEAFSYITPIWLRPSDLIVDNLAVLNGAVLFEWLATINLSDYNQNGFDIDIPLGCDDFNTEWEFEFVHPLETSKARIGSGLVFPGDVITYDIDIQNINEHVPYFVDNVNDSLLSENVVMEFSSSTGTTGRLEPFPTDPDADPSVARASMRDDGIQNQYVPTALDLGQVVTNTATVTFYIPRNIPPENIPPPWVDDPSIFGSSAPMLGGAEVGVEIGSPLRLEIEPTVEEAPVGSVFDITVLVRNVSNDFPISNVVMESTDGQFLQGLRFAGYPDAGIFLDTTGSQFFTITTPFFQIPTDFTGEEYEICATARGTLGDVGSTEVFVETCATITVIPADLTVEKTVHADNQCLTDLPDANMDERPEVEILNTIYFRIVIRNDSGVGNFYTAFDITDQLNTGETIDIQTLFDAELASFGNEEELAPFLLPGQGMVFCVPYQVPSTAIDLASLENVLTVEASVTKDPLEPGSALTVDAIVEMEAVDANLQITKQTTQNVAFPGDEVEYTLTILNRNTDGFVLILGDVYDSLVSGELPGDPSYVESCLAGWTEGDFLPTSATCDPSITSIPFDDPRWNWPTDDPGVIPSGDEATFTYTYIVQPEDPDPLLNLAGVDAYLFDNGANPFSNPANPWARVVDGDLQPLVPRDIAQLSLAITDSQLLVRKEATQSSALVGSQVNYSITITNIGDEPVSSIQVVDCYPLSGIPCNFGLEPFEPGFGGIDLSGQLTPVANLTSLEPFESLFVSNYSLTMPTAGQLAGDPTLDPYINTVFVTGQVDIGGGILEQINTSSDSAIVDLIAPGVTIIKRTQDDVGSAGLGETVIYEIEIRNTGDLPLRIDSVQDVLPGGVGGAPIDITEFNISTCDDGGPTYTVGSGATIAPYDPEAETPVFLCKRIAIVVTLPEGGGSEFINTVRVIGTVDPGGAGEATVTDGASTDIDIRILGLVVEKQAIELTSATPINSVQDGEEFRYRIIVTNGGVVPLEEIRLTDPLLDPDASVIIRGDVEGFGPGDANSNDLLDPGEQFIYDYNYTADYGRDTENGTLSGLENTVSVVAVDNTGALTPARTASVTVNIEPVEISVNKVACREVNVGVEPTFPDCIQPITFAQPGDFVWYQVTVTNPSGREVDSITLTDSLEGALTGGTWTGGIEGVLPACTGSPCPTAVFVYRGTNPVAGGANTVSNTVVVDANAGGAAIQTQDTVDVTVVTGELLVTITEQNDRTEVPAGTTLTFTVTVTNTSPDTAINNISLTLPLISGTPRTIATLAAGASQAETYTYTVQQSDNTLDFEAFVTGTLQGGLPVTDSDTYRVVRVTPGVSVTKVGDREFAAVGDTVMYTITIRNTGAQQINNLAVTDSLIDLDADPFPAVINAGDTITRMYSYQIVGDEGNPVVNTLLATGDFGVTPFAIETDWTVFIVGQNGEILTTNEPTRDSITAGESVIFNYSICNLAATTMTNITASDDDGALTLPGNSLDPNDCFFASREVVTTEADVPSVSRTITANGDVNSVTLSQSVTRTVDVTVVTAGDLSFEIIANPPDVVVVTTPTETLALTFVIRNTGTEAITITSFTDGRPWYTSYSPNPVGQTIDAGGTLTVVGNVLADGNGTGDIPVTDTTPDPITGTWTVTARDESNNTFTANDSISIPVLSSPGATLSVSYIADVATADLGDTITYTFTVSNLTGAAITGRLEAINNECETFTPDGNALWTVGGLSIDGGNTQTATATCVVPDPFAEPEINLTMQVFDTATPGTPQDTANVATTIAGSGGGDPAGLDVEFYESRPTTLQVDSASELFYSISNTELTGTLTGINLSFDPTCAEEDRVFYDSTDFTGANEITFDGTLAADTTIYVACPYTPDTEDVGTLNVSISATADGDLSDIDADTVPVVDISYTLQIIATPGTPNGNTGASTVSPDTTINFSFVITNNGDSTLALPAYDPDNSPITTNLRNVATGQSIGALGDPQAIYNFMASGSEGCDFPLAPTESCTVSASDLTGTTLQYTPTASSPTTVDANITVFLEEEVTAFPTAPQSLNWRVNVNLTTGQPDILATNLRQDPSPFVTGTPGNFKVDIQNNGTVDLTVTDVQFTLTQVSPTAQADDDTVLTSTSAQGAICAQGAMTLESQGGNPQTFPYALAVSNTVVGVFGFTFENQTNCTGSLQASVVVNATYVDGENVQSFTETTTFNLTLATDATDSTGTDPDGNPLDPNALDPTVSKTSTGEDGAGPGDNVTFTVTITNGSTNDMSIQLVDGVPSIFSIESVTASAGTPTQEGQEILLATTLTPGQRITLEIVTTLSPTAEVPAIYTNTACVASGDREPICSTAEVPTGAFGEGGGSLPATGVRPMSEPEESLVPSAQGFSGQGGVPGLLMMGFSLFLMMNIAGGVRPRWIIVGAVTLGAVVVIAGALIFGGGDETEKKSDDETPVAIVDEEGNPVANESDVTELPDTEFIEGTGVPLATPIRDTPTPLPGFPTRMPSPTPYSVEWSGSVRLDVPRLDFIRPIPVVPLPLQGTTWDVTSLGYNIGWLEETTWLEPDWGNTVLVAHVNLDVDDEGPFYYLFTLEIGDEIIIYEGDEAFTFEVYDITQVSDSAIEVTYPTRDPILTLMTCTNWDETRGVFAERRIVRAIPIGETPPNTSEDAPSQAG